MSIFEVLARHQREVAEAISEVRSAIASDQRAHAEALFQRAAIMLLAGLRAEHAVVYPRLADVAGLLTEVAQARREHDEIEQTLDRMRIGGLGPDAWDTELDRLARQVSQHADLEELSMFPIAALALSPRELATIDADYAAYLERARSVAGASITYDPATEDAPPRIVRFDLS